MLAEEGVAFLEDGRVDLSLCAWDPAKDDALLGPPPGFDWEEAGDREEQAPGETAARAPRGVRRPAAASTFSALR